MVDEKYNKVGLIPWDPTNEDQFQRMYVQRLACGWREEEVAEWKNKWEKGTKFTYWIVLSDQLPGADKLLADHIEKYADEAEPLIDTATSAFNTPREPTNAAFTPIGHIALEKLPDRDAKWSLPASTLWIASLYVSWAIQAGGLGRSAMAQLEAMGAAPPLNATVFALDTIKGEFQLSTMSLTGFYEERALKQGKVVKSTQEWYSRQGYEVFDEVLGGYHWKNPASGEMVPLPIMFMKKTIV